MQSNSLDACLNATADLTACRTLLRTGSKSFFAASLLLPKRIRDPASALYAFCRLADDAVDLTADPGQELVILRRRLSRAYAGNPFPSAVDRAFAAVIAAHAIPRAVPEALFEGFAWDAEERTYDTIEDLEAYAVRVAGTVGIMMAMLMRAREGHVLARACDLGVAMQLTTLARDVGEDARAGRLYLPRDWLRDAGVDPEAFLRRPVHSAALAAVVARLLDRAKSYYARANAGIAELPADCRPAIRAASLIYARIGRKIAACGYNSVNSRAATAKRTKLALIARAYAPLAWRNVELAAAPIASARALIEAAGDCVIAHRSVRRATLGDRAVRVLDLFERLERRSLEARAPVGR
jgi:phytoene synthase